MSQKVGRLQQENAKLREEIKKLKGALKDVNHEITQQATVLKPKREISPITRDRKKELREEIDSRLNYVIPSKPVLKPKSQSGKVEEFFEPEALVASFGQDEKLNFKKSSRKNEEILYEIEESPKTPKEKNDFSIDDTSSIDKTPESPEFESLPQNCMQAADTKLLKDSFSSFYDESFTKTQCEKPIEDKQTLQKPEPKKPDFQDLPLKPSNPELSSTVQCPEKILISEIEALRRENMKLRLQLTTSAKDLSLPEKTTKRTSSKNCTRRRSKSKSKSKSPNRKCISRSITPRDLSSRPLKRDSSNRNILTENDLTPRRSRHCHTCDHLLSKGYSTIYCSRHGTAKLPK